MSKSSPQKELLCAEWKTLSGAGQPVVVEAHCATEDNWEKGMYVCVCVCVCVCAHAHVRREGNHRYIICTCTYATSLFV